MKDSERLDLLKEVAGTRVYDERREESLKIMRDTDQKRKNIQDTLDYIEDRMKELSEESKELDQYLKVDKQRRALEYSIYDKELSATLKGLEEIDMERSKQSDHANSVHKKTLEIREKIRVLEKSKKTLNNELSTLKKEKSTLDEEKGELIKEKARLELDVKDTESRIKREKESSKKLDKERKDLEKQIKETSSSLTSALPGFEAISAEEKKLNERLTDNNRRIGELYAKQGRSSQFATKKERDAWIKNEVKQIDSQLKAKTEQVSSESFSQLIIVDPRIKRCFGGEEKACGSH